MPRTTCRLLSAALPHDLARIIVEYARDVELPAWDPYGFWHACSREYSKEGSYGFLPMVSYVDTSLPGLPLF